MSDGEVHYWAGRSMAGLRLVVLSLVPVLEQLCRVVSQFRCYQQPVVFAPGRFVNFARSCVSCALCRSQTMRSIMAKIINGWGV